ncbi:hypothetical protein JN531_017130 (plasmid) [Flagellatimonas centrodinii]|uniref:hypothetical protein n=1 Tax=Flagellatimonas centrodinii TaxID=2806210 RepID=UPI001FEE6AEB|nr:hypothetical protein [Flagellatimonas centrodinii]ULQ48356.1 hypothetical protein JN531_017130 [Flagellatimonas centrodinii]
MKISDLNTIAQACLMMSQRQCAEKLVGLHNQMRRQTAGAGAVAVRIEFFVYAVMMGVVGTLNGLADEHAPSSELSDRSLDLVFEDGDLTPTVVAQLAILADTCPPFADSLRKAGYQDCLKLWRTRPQSDLFAAV